MIDEIKDALGQLKDSFLESSNVMLSDIPRFLSLFIVGGIILGVFIGAGLLPNYTGITKNPDMAYCATPTVYTQYPILHQTFLFTPIMTYLSNPPLAEAELACPAINSDFFVLAILYAQVMAIVIISSLVGISVFDLSG